MKNLLMTPGPTPVPEEARLIMAKEMIHHRTDSYSCIFGEMSENLKYVFQTSRDVMTLTSSGTGAMEAAVVNLFSEGDKIAVFSVGNFGDRFIEISKQYKLNVIEKKYDWGTAAKVEDLKKLIEEEKELKGVFITHSETSTGVVNDIKSFGEVIRNTDVLLIVDAVSGLGANELKMDDWGVDCIVSGSQKGIMAPPGLAFAVISEKAEKALDTAKLPKFYFSFKKHLKMIKDNQTPWTPAINLTMSVNESLKIIKKEGLENVIERHKFMREATAEGVKALGLEFFVKDEKARGNSVTAVYAPEGINGDKVNKIMKDKHGVVIAGGQGNIKGKVFRIGHLGYVDKLDLIMTFSALEMTLKELGYNFEPGAGVGAVQKYLLEH